MRIWQLILTVCLAAASLCASAAAAEDRQPLRAPVMLANVYHPGIVLADYWVSEKYDGMRAYWDGQQLLTRGGERIHAPAWFIAGWPQTPLDGELWAGRGQFSATVAIARRQNPDDAGWRKMRYMVFDLPAHGGTFDQRLPALNATVRALGLSWVQAVRQGRVSDHPSLQKMLAVITKEGGEGLMLHRGASLYRAERNDDLLKLKLHDDAEARVLAHVPGKGRHQGRLGALLVETDTGQRFKIGSGFSDAERVAPPPVGSWVTYRYRGWNDSGIPRFASFLRVRTDMSGAPR